MSRDIFDCYACWEVIYIWWADARDALNILQWTEHPLQERITKMSLVPRLRNLAQVQL